MNDILKIALHYTEGKPSKPVKFPVEAFPGPIQEIINVVSSTSGLHPEFCGATILSAVAGLIGNSYKVQVKPGWIEHSILWMALVGDSSTKKTPVFNWFLKPIEQEERYRYKQYRQDIGDYESMSEKEKEKANFQKPRLKQLIVEDTTIEGLYEVLRFNSNGVLGFYDELMTWFKSFNRYRAGGGSDQQKYLSMYQNKDVRINRKMDDPKLIQDPAVTILGGIQPKVLDQLAGENRDGDGFLFRVDFAICESKIKQGWIDDEIPEAVTTEYDDLIKRIISMVANIPSFERVILQFSPEAKQKYIDWYNFNAKLIQTCKSQNRPSLMSFYVKMQGRIPRYCVVLQILKIALYELESPHIIKSDVVEDAIKLAEYFRYTACKVLDFIKVSNLSPYDRACEMYAEGYSLREIGEAVGKGKSTIQRWKDKDPGNFVRLNGYRH